VNIAHTAFIDLEQGLTDRVSKGWSAFWKPLGFKLNEAVQNKNWVLANALVDQITTVPIVEMYAGYAQTIGMASLLLGASRLGDIKKSKLVSKPPFRQLQNGVIQWGTMIARNASAALRLSAHLKLHKMEYNIEQASQVFTKDDSDEFVIDLDSDALTYMSTASSLLVSRLSSFGFLAEAYDQGSQYYQISAVLDDKTCDVCAALDGMIFPVDDGINQASAIMDAEDLDSLKSIAPWPKQSDASDIADSDAADLVDAGLTIPPYHPGCRCITTDVDDQQIPQQASPMPDQEQQAEVPSYLMQDDSPLGARVMGDLQGLTDEFDELVSHLEAHGAVAEAEAVRNSKANSLASDALVAAIVGAPLLDVDDTQDKSLDDIDDTEAEDEAYLRPKKKKPVAVAQ
jgi:hypothetical protein